MKKFLSGIAGFFVGMVLAGVASFLIYAGLQFGELGAPHAYFCDEAREAIQAEIGNKWRLTDREKDFYYYCDGFQSPHTVYAAFSGEKNRLEQFIEMKSEKKIADLPKWTGKFLDGGKWVAIQGPGKTALGLRPGEQVQKYLTTLYDLKHVGPNTVYCQDPSFFIYDQDNSRIFFCESPAVE